MKKLAKVNKIKNSDEKTTLEIELNKIEENILSKYASENGLLVGVTFFDNRLLTAKQQAKIYALLDEITFHTASEEIDFKNKKHGTNFKNEREHIKNVLKNTFCEHMKTSAFSLSNVDQTTASQFINYIIEFCFQFEIPFHEKWSNLTDDITYFLYLCIKYRKCSVTGKPGEIHHVDAIGAGRDRKEYDHTKSRLVCLSREMHSKAHNIGWETFKDLYHLDGIYLNAKQVKECHI
ncbi:putative HNHc nuclease [Listeria seeligeri]|uniref:putative HNHc nuclease n=1 Tax=Listeria seeligeri TaxID=1640 RepID=UPI0022EA4FE5|nr:putative HNHc nuclease [Listeria seeligeri]